MDSAGWRLSRFHGLLRCKQAIDNGSDTVDQRIGARQTDPSRQTLQPGMSGIRGQRGGIDTDADTTRGRIGDASLVEVALDDFPDWGQLEPLETED